MVLVGAPISPGAAGAKRRANVGPCTGKANDSDSDSAKKRLTQKRILANRVASGERCGKRARERERERERQREGGKIGNASRCGACTAGRIRLAVKTRLRVAVDDLLARLYYNLFSPKFACERHFYEYIRTAKYGKRLNRHY